MKLATNYLIRVLATGFVVLTLVTIPLFWLRTTCQLSLLETMPDDLKNISLEPSGYISPEIEKDPNLTQPSRISASLNLTPVMSLGLADYFLSRWPMGRRSDVYVAKSEQNWAFFDRDSGQIICRYVDTEAMPDRSQLHRQVQYYVGPEGISEIPDESLGRFVEPIIDFRWRGWSRDQQDLADLFLYDKMLGHFFKIDFSGAAVTKGPRVGDVHAPIQIGWLAKNTFLVYTHWNAPKKEYSWKDASEYSPFGMSMEETNTQPGGLTGDVIRSRQYHRDNPHLLVLDESGRIDLLDKETLEFAGRAGELPRPCTLFGFEHRATPTNTLSYSVSPLYLGERPYTDESEDRTEPKADPNSLRYAGMFAASLSHDGTTMALTAFDKDGTIRSNRVGARARHTLGEDVYLGAAWGPLCALGKCIGESLHPPILSVASCLTASTFEAGSGHNAVYLLPNSFFAMNARENRDGLAVIIITTLLLMLPAIILAAWLACRVTKDAAAVGLSKDFRRFWALLTLAFGLTGYITYRLMRPTITMVTCANCGKPRRPDTDTCHHCTAKWEIPELIPPTWRVLEL